MNGYVRFILILTLLCLIAGVLGTCFPLSPVTAGECYSGPRPGFTYSQEKKDYVKVFVSETVFVPVPLPVQLLVNIAPPEVLPPVTYSPGALAKARDEGQDRLANLEAAIARMEALLAGRTEGAQDLDLPPIPASARGADKGVDKDGKTTPPAQSIAVGSVPAMLKRSCAQCHSGTSARGDFVLFDARGNFSLPPEDRGQVYTAVKGDRMPKGPSKLTQPEKDAVKAWSQQTN